MELSHDRTFGPKLPVARQRNPVDRGTRCHPVGLSPTDAQTLAQAASEAARDQVKASHPAQSSGVLCFHVRVAKWFSIYELNHSNTQSLNHSTFSTPPPIASCAVLRYNALGRLSVDRPPAHRQLKPVRMVAVSVKRDHDRGESAARVPTCRFTLAVTGPLRPVRQRRLPFLPAWGVILTHFCLDLNRCLVPKSQPSGRVFHWRGIQ